MEMISSSTCPSLARMSVRKAVQEEMPKIVERMAKDR
jgi:hypothetical protein